MKKYEIFTDRFELRLGRCSDSRSLTAGDVFGEYRMEDANAPTRVARFASEAEALAAFDAEYKTYGRTHACRGVASWLLTGDVAYLEVNEYDDDDEFDQGGDVIAFSAEAYEAPSNDAEETDQGEITAYEIF